MASPNTEGKNLQYTYSVEQEVSVNAFLDVEIAGETHKLQVTSRYGSTEEKIVSTVNNVIGAIGRLRADYKIPAKPAPSENGKQEARTTGEGSYESPKSFVPSLLAVTYDKGKEFFKLHGQEGKFPKFPVTVWPEVLEAAGINYLDRSVVDPKDGFKLEGWTAYYIVNEKGNPGKVIRLEQSF